MAEHRERVDKRMSREVIRRVIIPLCLDLGARYLVSPYLGEYNDEEKTVKWGLGHKEHGDKRHRTHVTFQGINYRDGEKREGVTQSIEVDRHLGWSIKHDNRLVQNDETITRKIMSFEETFNKLRTFSSLDLIQRFSASAQGEVMGIGGSVSSSSEAHAHTEVETEKFNRTKSETVIEDHVRVFYPGPIRDADGRLVEEGEVWLVERPVATIHTVTPITQWGTWDSRILLNMYDWAGNYGPMPKGEHACKLEFSGFDELASFMHKDLRLRYKWLPSLKLSDESKRGLDWLQAEGNRKVGPVEWERIRVNENVSALEPTIITPE